MIRQLMLISLVATFSTFARAEATAPDTEAKPVRIIEHKSTFDELKIDSSELSEDFEKIPDFDKNSVQNDAELDADEQLVD